MALFSALTFRGACEPLARILVVDDEEGLRDFVAEVLEEEGHSTVRAEDGQTAAASLAKANFDLMITDLRMPGALDGMALLRKARAEQPDMEVIVLTAYGTVETAVEAMKLGAFDYLTKPIGSPAELRMATARALERRRVSSRRLMSRRSSVGSVVFVLPFMTWCPVFPMAGRAP